MVIKLNINCKYIKIKYTCNANEYLINVNLTTVG